MNELGIDSPSYLLDLQRGSWRNDGSLPPNWEELIDAETGRQYYVDHNTETTSWVDPRDIFIKPLGFADCTGHEFAFGWESSTDAKIGEYFIDHNSWCTTLTDPRINGTISHLTKISDLQGHLDTDVPNTQATHHGLHAMTSAFRGMRDKGGQRRLSKDLIDLHDEGGEHTAQLSDRISSLQSESDLVKTALSEVTTRHNSRQRTSSSSAEVTDIVTTTTLQEQLARLEAIRKAEHQEMWAELEATAQVFMPKTKLQAIINNQQAQIDELRKRLPKRDEYTGKRIWDDNLQMFVNQPEKAQTSAELHQKYNQLQNDVQEMKRTWSSSHQDSSSTTPITIGGIENSFNENATPGQRLSSKERLLRSAKELHSELDVAVTSMSGLHVSRS